MNRPEPRNPIWVSIGVIARNEAEAIGPALETLFAQSLFEELVKRGRCAEILCLCNACTDETPRIAAAVCAKHGAQHPHRDGFICHPLDLKQAGKLPAWNLFVHKLSAREARYLVLMDGDILLQQPTTLWNLCHMLDQKTDANVAVDVPLKDIALKARPTVRERLSLATSRLTQSANAQVTGQLYCIRADIARNIHLPRALPACEDGFIKSLVCTDFATRPSCPERIVRAPAASHVYEAYLSPIDILKNQKRQMIGQTFVHLLVDKCLPAMSSGARLELGRTLQTLDEEFPSWLEHLMAEHLCTVRFFWRIFPGVLTFRWRRLAQLRGGRKLVHLPATLAGFVVTVIACWLAWRALRRGSTDYWPDTRSRRLHELNPATQGGDVSLAAPATPH